MWCHVVDLDTATQVLITLITLISILLAPKNDLILLELDR